MLIQQICSFSYRLHTVPQFVLQPLRIDALPRLVEELGRHPDPPLLFEGAIHIVEERELCHDTHY